MNGYDLVPKGMTKQDCSVISGQKDDPESMQDTAGIEESETNSVPAADPKESKEEANIRGDEIQLNGGHGASEM
jgi:hypothetical protein